jgi:3-oxoacyl-[acyl-carrier protein] reductase
MSDRYQQMVNTPIGKIVSKQIGLPTPIRLARYERGEPVIEGPVLFGSGPGGRLAGAVAELLAAIEDEVHTRASEDETMRRSGSPATYSGATARSMWSYTTPASPARRP